MRLGLGARLAIAFALLAAVTALLTAGVASASTNRRVKDDVDQFLRDRAADIVEGRRRGPLRPVRPANADRPPNADDQSGDDDRDGDDRDGDGDPAAVVADPVTDDDSVLRAVEADAVVQLLDAYGNVSSTTGLRLPVADADLSYTADFSPALLRTEMIEGEAYRMITVHVSGGGAVQVAQSIATTNALLGQIRSELLVVGLGLSGLAGLIGWGVATSTTRPLRRLTASVESITRTQDLSQPVALDRNDELGRLSDSFDDLLRSLAHSRDQQQQLVQDAAHELRTPLTSVRANIDFLQRAPNLDTDTRSAALTSIRSELGELSDLLAEVVELATESKDATTFDSIDLVTAAEAALAQFELRSSRPVERDMRTSMVQGDLTMLSRAIGNLIGNADKYTADETSPVRVTVVDGTVVVADRGPGIPKADQLRVFERFWRADEARSASGSGLGLAIVKKAVEEHGGSVFVRDRPGGGSEIGFRVPVTGSMPA